MFIALMIERFRGAAGRFAGADRGNVAILFAATIIPILSVLGAAVDYSRVSSARSGMQAALDSTALMISKDLSSGTITAGQVSTKAQSYFAALYTNGDANSINVSATYTAASGGNAAKIVVNGSGSINTDFLKVANIPQINFNTSSTTTWGTTKLRVALALDNTGSMADDGKMTALKTAAANLIDQLSASAQSNGDVYISIVPFANWSTWEPASRTRAISTGANGRPRAASTKAGTAAPATMAGTGPCSAARPTTTSTTGTVA